MVASSRTSEVDLQLAALIQALAGAAGGVFSTAVLFPIDTLKTLIQAGKTRSNATALVTIAGLRKYIA